MLRFRDPRPTAEWILVLARVRNPRRTATVDFRLGRIARFGSTASVWSKARHGFVEECCTIKAKTEIDKKFLYDGYARYCEATKARVQPLEQLMMKSALAIALILCLPAGARGDDRPKITSEGRVQGFFCSAPKGFGDCVAACVAEYRSTDPARACAAICRKQFHC